MKIRLPGSISKATPVNRPSSGAPQRTSLRVRRIGLENLINELGYLAIGGQRDLFFFQHAPFRNNWHVSVMSPIPVAGSQRRY